MRMVVTDGNLPETLLWLSAWQWIDGAGWSSTFSRHEKRLNACAGGGRDCHTGVIASLFLPHLFFVTRQERRVFCLGSACALNRCFWVQVLDFAGEV